MAPAVRNPATAEIYGDVSACHRQCHL